MCKEILTAEKIKRLREECGLSQGQLSLYIGCTQSAIAKYEKKGCNNLAIAISIAVFFKIKLDEL